MRFFGYQKIVPTVCASHWKTSRVLGPFGPSWNQLGLPSLRPNASLPRVGIVASETRAKKSTHRRREMAVDGETWAGALYGSYWIRGKARLMMWHSQGCLLAPACS
jgi:hypothetical protein